jgi:hypothetical protein
MTLATSYAYYLNSIILLSERNLQVSFFQKLTKNTFFYLSTVLEDYEQEKNI